MIDGFSELSDAINDDIDPWLPNIPVMEPKIDIDTAKYIVARVGDKFCELVQQERESKSLAGDEGKSNVNKVVLRHYIKWPNPIQQYHRPEFFPHSLGYSLQ